MVGREPERQLLEALVEGARGGSAGTLVVRGEPGIGKSALLDELVAGAGDATVLRTQGLEVEAPLAFAALHRLLRPVTRLRGGLSEPQARALRVAFGEEEGPPVEPFLVGVATLSILTIGAEENPVLCVVDDAHWLDAATAGALLFCARRLGADRVALVFAVRDGAWGTFDPQGIPELVVTGLDPDASRTLLQARLGAATRVEVLDRIVAGTHGNPLALLELPAELTPDQLRGVEALPSQLHLTSRVEQSFLDRSRRLPPTVQTMMLVAAADDSGEPDVVRRAAAALGLVDADLQGAVDSGLLVETVSSLSFRHPLVRSAVYQAATGPHRRQVHRALAEALSGHGDPDREAWHRASAAEGPDPEVVDALEQAGGRAQRRGGHVAALAAYERAAALCDDPAQRTELTFAAARSAWACGRAGQAQALLSTTREANDPVLRADAARLRGHIEVNLGSASEAHRIFVEAAQAVHPIDPDRALDLGVVAAVMRTFGADSGAPFPVTDDLVVPLAGDSPRTLCLRHLLVAMTQVAEGDWSAATAALDRASEIGDQVDDRDVLWNLANAALQLGADRVQQHFYGYALARAREAGAVTAVVYCLQRLCFGQYLAGDLVAVRNSAEEAISLGRGIGQPGMTALPIAWLAVLAALQERDDHDQHLAQLDELVAAYPLGILADPVHDLTRWARGLRAAAAGDSAGALHHLARFRLPVLARMSAAERVEAAVRAGDMVAARGWTDELARFADATSRPWALATAAFGRALTAHQAQDADSLFRESLTHQAGAGRPLDAARTQLAYGEWLRRSQRRVDARQHLREAGETFQDLHAESLAARAHQELRASGETARKRDPSTLVELTPTELQIARLVSSGLSNKDVAAQCWISPRTVAFHLRNVFAKAGVTSRGELAQLDLA